MLPLVATILVIIGIVGLFVFDRDSEARTSKALWIPVIYLLSNGSRPLSAWLGLDSTSTVDGIYSSPIDQALQLALMALGLIVLFTRGRKVDALLRRSGPILLFFSYAALSILWSDFPFVTFKHWIKGIEDIVMVLVVLTDDDPVMAVKRLLTRAGFILIPLSLLLSMYYPSLGRIFTKAGETEYVGVTTQKNQLGMICMIFGLGSLWCFLRAYHDRESAARSRHLLAHGAMLGIMLWLLQMCHSLNASVCLTLAGALMVLATWRSPDAKPARVHLLVMVVVCSALLPFFFYRSFFESVGRDATLSGRTEIWDVVPNLVRNPWVGAGYETFLMGPRLVELREIWDNSFQTAHNGYLEVYLNLGWIGVSLFALLVIAGYRRVVAAFRWDPAFGSLGLAFFVAVLIYGLAEAPFRMLMPTCFFLLWSIIGASQSPAAESPDRPLEVKEFRLPSPLRVQAE